MVQMDEVSLVVREEGLGKSVELVGICMDHVPIALIPDLLHRVQMP
jgi:hypothetical protein